MLALALVRAKDEGQTLETSALETLYFGKFTLSTKLSRNTPPPLPPRSTAVSLKTWPSSTVCNWPLVGHKSGFLPLTRLALVISSKTLKNKIYRYDEGLTLETSAFLPFAVANLRFQPSC